MGSGEDDDDDDNEITNIKEFIEEYPAFGITLLVATIVCLLYVAIRSYRHLKLLESRPPSQRRTYYYVISSFPLVIAFYCLCVVLSPRLSVWFEVVRETWFSVTLLYFGWLLIDLAGGEFAMVKELSSAGEQHWWNIPPCGCLITPCSKPTTFSRKTLVNCQLMLVQYIVIVPCLALAEAINLAAQRYRASGTLYFLAALVVVSSLISLQGLAVLLSALKTYMDDYQIPQKVRSIAGMIFLIIVQPAIILLLGFFCSPDRHAFSVKAWATLCNCCLLLIELIPLYEYTASAYPHSELEDDEAMPLVTPKNPADNSGY
ncbi:hypothetical protein CYMTET_12213 [Cymbomonas tetramitiformis]|uniref:Uncharacterized protein n=1 Tax=Cymbomonas tetramitiformis TaxID=36881 RepID=A0AAE0LCD7_9CHLO|nr:hypothetical protein CYMTET_12213 [Cymbomonas tetramitiformis]